MRDYADQPTPENKWRERAKDAALQIAASLSVAIPFIWFMMELTNEC